MSKRQRPCDFCRSRKAACRIEGSVPCRLCALHGRSCTFVDAAQPKSRSRTILPNSPEGHVLQSDVPGADGSGTQPVEASRGHAASATSASPQDHIMEFLDPQMSPSQIGAHNISDQAFTLDMFAEQFFGDLGNEQFDLNSSFMYSALPEGSSPNTPRTAMESQNVAERSEGFHLDHRGGLNPQVLGYSGDMDPYLLQNYRYDRSGAFHFKQLSIQSAYHGTAPTQFLLSQPGLFSWSRKEMGLNASPEASRTQLENVVPTDTGRRLISLYRRFILAQYPIFSESAWPDPHTTAPSLLAAIYMIAQPFAKFDDVLSIELAYDTLNSHALFAIIHEALHYEAHNPSLELVQMILLLVVRTSTNPLILESSLKWSLHGTLISTAQIVGLHCDPASWAIAPWQKALRRRLSCTIFTIDKWLACSLGRPPLLGKANWLVTNLTDEDSHTSTMNTQMWLKHLHYARLGELLGEVLEKLL